MSRRTFFRDSAAYYSAEILHQAPVDREEKGNWLEMVAGSFENDPEFDEVVRLGKEHSGQPVDEG